MSSRFYERPTSYIKQDRLTDSLYLLEQFGYDPEVAISLLRHLQSKGVRA